MMLESDQRSPSGQPLELAEQTRGRVLPARIPSLDGLRAISIFLVLQGHMAEGIYYPSESKLGLLLGSLTGTGVKIFFVISGYLITLLLLQETERTGRVDLGHFYSRRAFRILPAAYAYMAVVFVVFHGVITRANAILAVFFAENYSLHPQTQTLSHLWSLGVEEQFYLLWPVIFVFLPRRRVSVLAGVLLAVPFINVVIIHFHWPLGNGAFYSVADVVSCGCLLALLRDHPIVRRITGSPWVVLWTIPVVLLSPLIMTDQGQYFGAPLKSLVFHPLLNVAIAFCVEGAVRFAPRWLNTGWIVYLGTLSYSLYLWQAPLARAAMPNVPSHPDLLLRLLAIFGCALASFYLVEQPFLRLRRRLFA